MTAAHALELRHYSHADFALDRAREYAQIHSHKPYGLWVSVPGDDDWPHWCRTENWRPDRFETEAVVTLAPGANVLVVPTLEALDAFHEEYAQPNAWARDVQASRFKMIDWRPVAERYDGIVIAPYQWPRRFTLDWYYTWDVASGCIWNLDAIASIESVQV